MEQVRTYVISVVTAAMLVGIVTGLLGKKDTSAALIKMIGGLFLAFTVIRPIVSLEVENIRTYIAAFSENGTNTVTEGENLAGQAYSAYIKSETEAYILDKANALGAELSVEVSLDEGDIPVPVGARIQGSVSPYAKACLQDMMADDLGILEENQVWIG